MVQATESNITFLARSNVVPFPMQNGAKHRIASQVMQKIETDIKARRDRSSEDRIYGYIERHRQALREDDPSDYALYSRCLILGGAQTRKGLIALLKYISEQLDGNASRWPETINDKPWLQEFLRHLSADLRRMGREFPKSRTR